MDRPRNGIAMLIFRFFYWKLKDLIKNFNITNGALEHFKQNKIDMIDILILIEKHKFNEDENPSEEDLQANVNALHNGGMFLSVYNIANEKVYIIS